jgi:excinuclease UvrABC nuclease subunit
MADNQLDWEGASGKKYAFYLHEIGTDYKDEPGNYIFARLSNNTWVPIYIGETDSLKDRLYTNLTSHHKYDCAVNMNGATHFFTRITSGGEQARLDIETDLVHAFNPPCND